jgi:hypothetical protein
MWTELVAQLRRYPSTVLTALDDVGYPVSVRCQPRVDEAVQVLHIALAGAVGLQAGPASILCHAHDEQLWHLTNVLIRGTIEQSGDGWIFRPKRLIHGQSRGPLYFLRVLLDGRRAARHYLTKLGLPRPQIPWWHIQAVRAEASSRAR